MAFYLERSAKFSNRITELTFLHKKKNASHLLLKQAKFSMKFKDTKLLIIRKQLTTMIKYHLAVIWKHRFSNSQSSWSVKGCSVFFLKVSIRCQESQIQTYVLLCSIGALTFCSLKYLPQSPAVVLDLWHTFAVKILLVQCYGPGVSYQAQQQGEDLNKEIMCACKLQSW